MEYSTLIARLKTAAESFENLEVQLADPDIASDPKKLESIARERSKLEPLVIDFNKLLDTEGRVDRFMKKYGMGSANSATSKDQKEEKDSKK